MHELTNAQIDEMAARGAIERTGGKGSYRRLLRNLVRAADERSKVKRLADAANAALSLYEARYRILVGRDADEVMDELRIALGALRAHGATGRDDEDDDKRKAVRA